jgi:hypothetical protein
LAEGRIAKIGEGGGQDRIAKIRTEVARTG